MGSCRIEILTILSVLLLFFFQFQSIHGWGEEWHLIVCRIAQSRLTKRAEEVVENLLPKSAENDLGSVCSWAGHVKFIYHWSSALHYIDTPDNLCNYQYERDCKDGNGEKGRCVAGAINNYTTQLLNYGKHSKYNLTQALLFLSHFMGDIHQPRHVGFTSDRGGNTIDVHCSNVDDFIKAIQRNITTEWDDQVKQWETCSYNKITCPDIFASEGIKAACEWAYKGVTEGSVLEDEYFLSHLPIVNLRLAQGGVRLAGTLNRIFG